eukprot:gene22740-27014_t
MSRRLVRTPGGLGLDLRWAYGGEVCWLNKSTHSLRQSVEHIHTESTREDHVETHREEHEFIDQSQEGLQVCGSHRHTVYYHTSNEVQTLRSRPQLS